MKNKNILITGGFGFIGQKLCEKFLNMKYTVLCVDKESKEGQPIFNRTVTLRDSWAKKK